MRIAFIVGIDDYTNNKSLKLNYCVNDAVGIKESFLNIGFDNDDIDILINHGASKASIESGLIKIAKYARSTDDLFFYYAGHGLSSGGVNYLTCSDTILDDLERTAIPMSWILSQLEESESNRKVLFVDACHSGIKLDNVTRDGIQPFDSDSLKYKYRDSEYLLGFASCKHDEVSYPDREKSHGIWTSYLIEALSGNGGDIYDNGLLFGDKLQEYLYFNTQSRLGDLFTGHKTQTPIKFGKETNKTIIADVTKLLQDKEDIYLGKSIELKDVALAAIITGDVSRLPGFDKKKGHKIYSSVTYKTNQFVISVSGGIIEDDIRDIYKEAMKKLKLSIKDLKITSEEGKGSVIIKNYFDYHVELVQNENDPSEYKVERVLSNINVNNITMDILDDIFDDRFDEYRMIVEGVDEIEDVIMKIQNSGNSDVLIDYDPLNTESCTIKIKGYDQYVRLERNTVTMISKKRIKPSKMVEEFRTYSLELSNMNIKGLIA